jgi:hypothetical protein
MITRPTLLAFLVASPLVALTGQHARGLDLELGHRAPTPTTSPLAILADEYHVRLTSAWPQFIGADGCLNGGEETIDGTLERTADGGYAGVLRRMSRISFCGPHGPDVGSCGLTLNGDGAVRATVVFPGASGTNGQSSWLEWTPDPAASRTSVSGSCGGHFDGALQAMYLGASHGVELILPFEDSGALHQRIEDFGWVADVEQSRSPR